MDNAIECLRSIDEAMANEFNEHGTLKDFYLKVRIVL